jgi:hypothetical protein
LKIEGDRVEQTTSYDLVAVYLRNAIRTQLTLLRFCVKTGSNRVFQEATKELFETMSECDQHIPVIVVATQMNAYRNEKLGELAFALETSHDKVACVEEAQSQLDHWTAQLQETVLGLHRTVVDSVVRVDRGKYNGSRHPCCTTNG